MDSVRRDAPEEDVYINATTSSNDSNEVTLPIDMQFNDGHLLSVITYSILMVLSAIGNLSVVYSILKMRTNYSRLTRVNLLLMHLAVADLLVTFLMMPIEIGWNLTVSWEAGDFMCRLMSFFRTFGLYLSGFIVICISFDRYFAVLKPLSWSDADRRTEIMLITAWVSSIICSLPQSWVFHLETHPTFKWYKQCITVNSFSSRTLELVYYFFGFTFMYAIPLLVILFCYSAIFIEINKAKSFRRCEGQLQRSSSELLSKAKKRTLKLTIIVALSFFLLWTPYNLISIWYWVDQESAKTVDYRIQKIFFLFACTNSCVNPLIYGLFHVQSQEKKNGQRCQIRQALLKNKSRLPTHSVNRSQATLTVRWKASELLCQPSASDCSSCIESYNLQPLGTQLANWSASSSDVGPERHSKSPETLMEGVNSPYTSSNNIPKWRYQADFSISNTMDISLAPGGNEDEIFTIPDKSSKA